MDEINNQEKESTSLDCCGKKAENTKDSKGDLKQGILYGLIPHIGCIAFILFTIVGATAAASLFKPLLLNSYFFYGLVALSFGFATLGSALYLKKNGLLSFYGAKKKKRYLATMYGTTIGINLLLFMVIFPMLANVGPAGGITGAYASNVADFPTMKISVDIPCSGHASLITGELKTINGVIGVVFSLPNNFDITYDPNKTTKQQILSLDVFSTYKATVLSESISNAQNNNIVNNNIASGGSCGTGSSGCGSGCGCSH